MKRLAKIVFVLLVILTTTFLSWVVAACNDIATFADGLTPTSKIHVDPTGSDLNRDGSAQHSFVSIRHAVGEALPGMAVIIHVGTFLKHLHAWSWQGHFLFRYWIGGAQAEARPVIQGSSEAIHITASNY